MWSFIISVFLPLIRVNYITIYFSGITNVSVYDVYMCDKKLSVNNMI